MTTNDKLRDELLIANNREGFDINEQIEAEHKDGDQFAIIRKEIRHIEQALNIQPTEEFKTFDERAEAIKATVKARLDKSRK